MTSSFVSVRHRSYWYGRTCLIWHLCFIYIRLCKQNYVSFLFLTFLLNRFKHAFMRNCCFVSLGLCWQDYVTLLLRFCWTLQTSLMRHLFRFEQTELGRHGFYDICFFSVGLVKHVIFTVSFCWTVQTVVFRLFGQSYLVWPLVRFSWTGQTGLLWHPCFVSVRHVIRSVHYTCTTFLLDSANKL